MTTLNDYLQEVQRFVREVRQELLNPDDLRMYINAGRREVAMRAQCIRRLTPSSGSLMAITVTNPGSGYSANSTVVTISAPDFPSGQLPNPQGRQATALAIVQGGAVTAIYVQDGGSGYFQPTVTITDGAGVGATAVVTQMSYINALAAGQEQYNFADIDVSMFPGVDSIFAVKSVSIIYANYRYTLPMYSFSVYQALIRQYPYQYQWVPAFSSQYGQGTDGSLFMYPLPSQVYQYELDCFCLPSDLIDNQSVEAIPAPWTQAVKYYAASHAFLELQNFNAAEYYSKKFDDVMPRYRSYATPSRAINPYGGRY